MDTLKKIFPLSFKYVNDVVQLIVGILLQLLVGVAAGVCIFFLVPLPLVGIIVGALGGLIDLYVLVGIILQILAFAKVIN